MFAVSRARRPAGGSSGHSAGTSWLADVVSFHISTKISDVYLTVGSVLLALSVVSKARIRSLFI